MSTNLYYIIPPNIYTVSPAEQTVIEQFFNSIKISPSIKRINHVIDKINRLTTIHSNFCRGVIDVDHMTDQMRSDITIYAENNRQEILGSITVEISHSDRTGEIDQIYINALCTPTSTGNGARMVRAVKRLAHHLRCQRIRLESSGPSIAFYRKQGFIEVPGVAPRDGYVPMVYNIPAKSITRSKSRSRSIRKVKSLTRKSRHSPLPPQFLRRNKSEL